MNLTFNPVMGSTSHDLLLLFQVCSGFLSIPLWVQHNNSSINAQFVLVRLSIPLWVQPVNPISYTEKEDISFNPVMGSTELDVDDTLYNQQPFNPVMGSTGINHANIANKRIIFQSRCGFNHDLEIYCTKVLLNFQSRCGLNRQISIEEVRSLLQLSIPLWVQRMKEEFAK